LNGAPEGNLKEGPSAPHFLLPTGVMVKGVMSPLTGKSPKSTAYAFVALRCALLLMQLEKVGGFCQDVVSVSIDDQG